MRLSETAKEVIALADAIHSYWSAELPKRHRDYPLVHPGEDSGPPPPEEKQLRDLLENLPKDLLYKVVLLTHLGRGDFGTDDLAGHYQSLKETFEEPESAVATMLEKAPLADYLADGLEELKRNRIDADNLTFTSVGAE